MLATLDPTTTWDDLHTWPDMYAELAGPDDDDADDPDNTPVVPVLPWDDDRRRFEGEHLLHLNSAEWELIDSTARHGYAMRGIGSRCAHVAGDIRTVRWGVAGPKGEVPVFFRPSPAIGGTFIIFPGGE
jgi:hypothetical protein